MKGTSGSKNNRKGHAGARKVEPEGSWWVRKPALAIENTASVTEGV